MLVICESRFGSGVGVGRRANGGGWDERMEGLRSGPVVQRYRKPGFVGHRANDPHGICDAPRWMREQHIYVTSSTFKTSPS